MISHLSYSSLSMALRCPKQFEYRYIEGKIIPPGIALGVGRGFHKGAEVNFANKIHTHEDIPRSDILDAAATEYREALSNGVALTDEELPAKDRLIGEGLDKTVRLTDLFARQTAPGIQPIEVERKFSFDVGVGIPVIGFIDLVDDLGTVIDLKTAAKSWSQSQAAKSLQPVFYSIGYRDLFNEILTPTFRYLIHVDKKKPAVQDLTRFVTVAQEDALMNMIRVVLQMIKSGVFPPADPGSWACSEKYCGFHKMCPYTA